MVKKATKWLVLSVLFYPVRVICQREKKRTVSQVLYFCMKKKTLIDLITAAVMSTFIGLTAYASGDVAGAVEGTWTTARAQVVSVVDNVIFPVIDVILTVLLFVKISMAYMEYRKHGQLEWTPIAIIFGCLIFTLTAPLYIWSIV